MTATAPPPAEPEPVNIPPPEVTTTTTPPEAGTEMEHLQLQWKQIIADAPADVRKSNAIAILRSAGVKPVAFKDDTVVLAFRYKIHKENMEKPENQQIAQKIISNFLGRTCRVHCLHEPEDNHLVDAAKRLGAQIIDTEEK